jgi:hypothetical protein
MTSNFEPRSVEAVWGPHLNHGCDFLIKKNQMLIFSMVGILKFQQKEGIVFLIEFLLQ